MCHIVLIIWSVLTFVLFSFISCSFEAKEPFCLKIRLRLQNANEIGRYRNRTKGTKNQVKALEERNQFKDVINGQKRKIEHLSGLIFLCF